MVTKTFLGQRRLRAFLIVLALNLFSSADAEEAVRGKIQMIQPTLVQSLVYVHLQGYPTVDGGGCRSQFMVGKMDDTNFKSYVFSTLLAAKAANGEVVMRVNGCYLGYPLISGIEYSPRE
ncbi:hypothetical protein [Cognatilysobacter terrigena]|uniref:hypothetical protein n=1 Tax=Cognatilysobacter terrigena TaxID=2488749 RepID=UPI00105FA33B|nr:hypothetical protein [Lysobacter terrigena]